MRVGYGKPGTRKEHVTHEKRALTRVGVDTVFVDRYTSKEVWQKNSQFREMIEYCYTGDTVVLVSLDRVSRSYGIWLEVLAELAQRDLELEIQLNPRLTRAEWETLIKWCYENEQHLERRVKLISVGQESREEARRYQAFSSDVSGRKLYWAMFSEVLLGKSLRQLAKTYQVSRGTVYRIKQQVAKVKQGVALAGTFMVTIMSMEIARYYLDNLFLQLLIGAGATVAVIYLSYSDMEGDS